MNNGLVVDPWCWLWSYLSLVKTRKVALGVFPLSPAWLSLNPILWKGMPLVIGGCHKPAVLARKWAHELLGTGRGTEWLGIYLRLISTLFSTKMTKGTCLHSCCNSRHILLILWWRHILHTYSSNFITISYLTLLSFKTPSQTTRNIEFPTKHLDTWRRRSTIVPRSYISKPSGSLEGFGMIESYKVLKASRLLWSPSK